MTESILFKINRPQVISQIIDGEVVAINLQTGSYYSLTGAAAVIWDAVECGKARSQIILALDTHFTDCDTRLEGIVDDFLNELRNESLIIQGNGGASTNNALNDAPIQREKFVPPALKKFTDMQELLLLDPIHEVDATGWPLAKPEPDSHADK